MVCAHCGSQSHRTKHQSCPEYCTLCKERGHRQKGGECRFRVCIKCGASGHSATECNQTGCSECGNTTHKRRATFKIVECSSLDPNKLFGQSLIIRRIAELELLAHEHSVNTASALEATFQAKMHISPTDPGYASNRARLCYHLTQNLAQTPSHTSLFALCD